MAHPVRRPHHLIVSENDVRVDDDHRDLANRLIATMNAMLKEGYDTDFVASAAVSAAGAFTAFNLSDGGRRSIAVEEIADAATQFAERITDALSPVGAPS